VGGGSHPKFLKNKVMIWDDFQIKCIAELEFRSDVRGVRLRRDRIVVVLENKVYVYNFADLKLLDQIDTYPNPKGLCALSPSSDSFVMAVPGMRPGEVRVDVVKDISSAQPKSHTYTLTAHNNPIHLLALDMKGGRLATCSDRGTLVRIFDVQSGKMLKELRRGAQQASIQSLAFNHDGSLLAVTSDKGTVHLYSLPALDQSDPNSLNNQKSSFSFMKSLLPIVGSEWSFTQFSVPENQSVCAFGQNNSVIVLGASGTYYKYSFVLDKEKASCKEETRDVFYKNDD
jgi:WD40 repeat protein